MSCHIVQHETRNGVMCLMGMITVLRKQHPDVDFEPLRSQVLRVSEALQHCNTEKRPNG